MFDQRSTTCISTCFIRGQSPVFHLFDHRSNTYVSTCFIRVADLCFYLFDHRSTMCVVLFYSGQGPVFPLVLSDFKVLYFHLFDHRSTICVSTCLPKGQMLVISSLRSQIHDLCFRLLTQSQLLVF